MNPNDQSALVMSQLLCYIAMMMKTLNELISCLNHYDLFTNEVTFLTQSGWNA